MRPSSLARQALAHLAPAVSARFAVPGCSTLDMSLAKFFNLTERYKMEFRAEAINLINTPILNSPNTGSAATLGLLNGAGGATDRRQIQFALKFHY